MVQSLVGLVLFGAISVAAETAPRSEVLDACKIECPKAKRPHELHMCLRRLEEQPASKASISEHCKMKFEAYQEHKTSGHFGKRK